MTTESDLRARVERGATFLDQAEPYWWKLIERELVLSDCSACVLGQMFGGDEFAFDRALATFVGPDEVIGEWAVDHGFDSYGGAGYEVLDRLWLEAIEARRANPDRYVP